LGKRSSIFVHEGFDDSYKIAGRLLNRDTNPLALSGAVGQFEKQFRYQLSDVSD